MIYADDIVLLAETKEELLRMLRMVEDQCNRHELVVNREKTKRMKIGCQGEAIEIQLSDGEMEQTIESIVISIVIYGAECWVLKKREEKKLLAFEMKRMKRIYGVTWEDRIMNEKVREMADVQETILIRVKDIQRRRFGHVQRMEQDRWPKIVRHGRVAGNRPRGLPRDS
ncbi:uncharacterized protein [Palaemon carinicauda]|uniref:uncharacterized protein n=1 Tax=Palaemon carinicauda TaxID=392227 RepID=UPI0035B59F86